MPKVFDYFALISGQCCGIQQYQRTPEPSQITDGTGHVSDYDRVMTTPLVVPYAVALEILYRVLPDEPSAKTAIDLACGPGHFSLCLARYLSCDRVTGFDLSAPMVAVANANAQKVENDAEVSFEVRDATTFADDGVTSPDLITFTDAAHHMPDIETVGEILGQMEKAAKPDGSLFVMDVARMRTAKLTERFIKVVGEDYLATGLPHFYEDFRNSMHAAWTPRELLDAVPAETTRTWWQLVPRCIPSIQFLIGLPSGRDRLFLRRGVPWRAENHPVPVELQSVWRALRFSVRIGRKRRVAA